MEIPENLYKKLIGQDKSEISNGVRAIKRKTEKDLMPKMAEALVVWAGKQLWLQGYELKDLEMFKKDYDYGRGISVAMTLKIESIPLTVRQFCYEYLKLAESIKKENDKLRSFWLYRLLRLFAKD